MGLNIKFVIYEEDIALETLLGSKIATIWFLLKRLLWTENKRVSRRLPLLIHFNCCSSCTAGYDILLNKLSLVSHVIKIDTFTSNYTKTFPFFHIKSHNKFDVFLSDLWGCWGQRRPWKIKVPKFQIWHPLL